jgi:hypothetical protein
MRHVKRRLRTMIAASGRAKKKIVQRPRPSRNLVTSPMTTTRQIAKLDRAPVFVFAGDVAHGH